MEYFDGNGKMKEHVYNLNGTIYYKGVPIQKAKSALVATQKETIDNKGKVTRKSKNSKGATITIVLALASMVFGGISSYVEEHNIDVNEVTDAIIQFLEDGEIHLDDFGDGFVVQENYEEDESTVGEESDYYYDSSLGDEMDLNPAKEVSAPGIVNVDGYEFELNITAGELEERLDAAGLTYEFTVSEAGDEQYLTAYVYKDSVNMIAYMTSDYVMDAEEVDDYVITYIAPAFYYSEDGRRVEYNWCVSNGICNGMTKEELLEALDACGGEPFFGSDDELYGYYLDEYSYYTEFEDDVLVNICLCN